jgi:hypothetical protein
MYEEMKGLSTMDKERTFHIITGIDKLQSLAVQYMCTGKNLVIAANFFFLFHPNAHNMFNTYIYHLLPATCLCVYYTISKGSVVLFTLELYASCNVVTQVVVHNIRMPVDK